MDTVNYRLEPKNTWSEYRKEHMKFTGKSEEIASMYVEGRLKGSNTKVTSAEDLSSIR